MYKIVTISREFGCNARGIAQKLANELNFAYYDKSILINIYFSLILKKPFKKK